MPEQTSCDVCRRTMLKGERAEPYLTPSRERRSVCALCAPRAQREGWIRESVAPETPTRPARQPDRLGLIGRIRRRRAEVEAGAAQTDQGTEPVSVPDAPDAPERKRAEREPQGGERSTPRDRRNIRAVPTNAQLKLDRAVEVFNDCEHRRTIAGLARTLGPPQVSAIGSSSSAAEVVLTIAWELAWYQYVIDLSDPREPVQLRSRGEELDELDEQARQWNVTALGDGLLAIGSAPGQASDAPVQDGP